MFSTSPKRIEDLIRLRELVVVHYTGENLLAGGVKNKKNPYRVVAQSNPAPADRDFVMSVCGMNHHKSFRLMLPRTSSNYLSVIPDPGTVFRGNVHSSFLSTIEGIIEFLQVGQGSVRPKLGW